MYTHTHTHTHTRECYAAIKKEISPFATTWMELESIMLSEILRERQLSYDLADMWNLRNKAEDHRGIEEKMKQDETREGDKP